MKKAHFIFALLTAFAFFNTFFSYSQAPSISSFSPGSALQGATVTIKGRNFFGTTSVIFGYSPGYNRTPAASFSVVSDSVISAVVGSGTSGKVWVTTPMGVDSLGDFTFIKTTVHGFDPKYATTGYAVSISGANLSGATSVKFGGIPAASFTVDSSGSKVTAIVGSGSSGNVSVTTPIGSDSANGFVFLTPSAKPAIISFSPIKGKTNDTIFIKGENFLGTSSVLLGGTTSRFKLVSDTLIWAFVGTGSSGKITIKTPTGTDSLAGFTYIDKPVIQSINPTIGITGSSIYIRGLNFIGATSVTFGGVPAASFVVGTDTGKSVTATVGVGASGKVVITTPNGTDSISGFTYLSSFDKPSITSFSPTSASTGKYVIIKGENFIGVSAVSFGNRRAASFTVDTLGQIFALVGEGASGKVYVTTPAGTDSLAGFTYIPSPKISSFNPSSGTTGTSVIIRGTNFEGATNVFFGGISASSFTIDSIGKITAIVGSGKTGSIEVYTPKGADTTVDKFTFIGSVTKPSISSFTPTSGSNGTTIRINGTNLANVTAITFGGVQGTVFNKDSANGKFIDAIVGDGAAGYVRVASLTGTDSLSGFSFTGPRIFSFSPDTGYYGATVKIKGEKFDGVTSVKFGGIDAKSFKIDSSSQITAIMDYGRSGQISVETPNGNANSKKSIAYNGPLLFSFSPRIGTTGTSVRIYGDNFKDLVAVNFGKDTAKSFKIDSSFGVKSIIATVGNGTSGKIKITTKVDSVVSRDSFYFRPNPFPVIKSFSPTSGGAGAKIKIEGTDLFDMVSISFGGTQAYIQPGDTIKGTFVYAILDQGSSGHVKVTSKYGADSLPGFSFTSPIIKSFSPISGNNGTIIKISGKNFSGVSSVRFGTTALAKSFTVESDTLITAIVGNGQSGNIFVINANGLGASSQSFTYNGPYIYNIDPTKGPSGSIVRIRGEGFTGVSTVSFGGIAAQSFIVDSVSLITAIAAGGNSGLVSVSTLLGTTSFDGFTFIKSAPTINYSNDTIFCKGGSVILTSSSLSNNQWYKDGVPLAGDTGRTYLVTYSGTYSVLENNNGISSAMSKGVKIIVNALPTAGFTVGKSEQCFKHNYFQFTNTSKAVNTPLSQLTYKWNFGDTSISTLVSPNYSYSSTGSFVVKLITTAPSGCKDSTITVVKVNPSPNVVSPVLVGFEKDTTICFTDSLLISSRNQYDKYLWSTGDTAKSVTVKNTANIYLKIGTKYPVCYSDSSVIIRARKNNTPTPSIIRVFDNLVSSVSKKYQWYFNNKKLSKDTVTSVRIFSKGLYKVETSIDNFCWTPSREYNVQSDPLLVDQKDFELAVFPNPISGQFYLLIKLDRRRSGFVNINIVDAAGTTKWLFNKFIFNDMNIKIPMNLNLNKGTFTVQVSINGYKPKAIQIIGL